MPGLISKLSICVVLSALVSAVALGIAVIFSCEYLNGSSFNVSVGKVTDVDLGVFAFKLDDPDSEYNTDGECVAYSEWPEGEDVPGTIRTAQVCSILGPASGMLLLLLVLLNQCCCPIPCSGPLVSLSYTTANVCTSLVWLIRRNDVCDRLGGGCEWGQAAILNLVVQILYVVASFAHRFLPDPKETRRARQEDKDRDDGDRADTNNVAAPDNAEVKRLQGELDQAKQRANVLQGQLDQNVTRLQVLETENEKQKKALATATAVTSAAATAEAVELKKIKKQMEEQKNQYETTVKELHDDNVKKEKALVAATAATSTAAAAEAVEIKKLKDELQKQQEQLEQAKSASTEFEARIKDLQDENNKKENALAVATAATSAAAMAEAVKIKTLTDELEQTKKAAEEYQRRIQELQDDNTNKEKALAVATAAASTAAGAEAVKIKQLSDDLEQAKAVATEYEAKMKQLQANNDEKEKALAIATTATSTSTTAEALEIKKLQVQLAEKSDETERLCAEIEALKAATEAAEDPAATTEVGSAGSEKGLEVELGNESPQRNVPDAIKSSF